jgi:hypothetical protein
MELTQIEKEFANKRMHYYVNIIGLDPNTASKVVNEELKQHTLIKLKEKQINKPSTVANYVQRMHNLKEQMQKQT